MSCVVILILVGGAINQVGGPKTRGIYLCPISVFTGFTGEASKRAGAAATTPGAAHQLNFDERIRGVLAANTEVRVRECESPPLPEKRVMVTKDARGNTKGT